MRMNVLKVPEARKLVGKKVEWEQHFNHARGTCNVYTGVIKELKYRNVFMENGDTLWLPDMKNLKEID